MRSNDSDEAQLVQYLLGNLTEEEQILVEDRAFSEPDYRIAIEAAEADLIDAYVGGELKPADRRAFERMFLASPGRRKKVEFARALALVTADMKPSEDHDRWQTLALWIPRLQFAVAFATVMLVLTGVWLFSQNAALRDQLAEIDVQRRDMEFQYEKLRDQFAALSKKPPAPVESLAPVIASLVFPVGITRDASGQQQLVLPAAAQIARLEIPIDAADDHPRFRADLRRRSGQQILTLSNLSRRQSGAGYTVLVEVPASALAAAEYELVLEGTSAGQPPARIGFYYFKVQRPKE